MYCQQCKSYIPTGLDLTRCPSCDADLSVTPPIERLTPLVETPPVSENVVIEKKVTAFRIGYFVYLFFFVLLASVSFNDNLGKYPLLFSIFSAISYGAAATGILFYGLRYSHRIISMIWKFYTPIFIVHLIVEGSLDQQQSNLSVSWVAVIWLLAIAFFYPALKANFNIAFPEESAFRQKIKGKHLISYSLLVLSLLFIALAFFVQLPLPNLMGLFFCILICCLIRIFIFKGARKRSKLFAGTTGVVIYLLLIFFVIKPYKIFAAGMHPALSDGDHAVVVLYKKQPVRGDIIIFKDPEQPLREQVNRVAALPGETVEIKEGHILVNGEPLTDQPFEDIHYYNGTKFFQEGEVLTVPEEAYFVLGDNSALSRDSRYFSFIPAARVKGTVVGVIRPWLKVGWIQAIKNRFTPSQPQAEEYDLTQYYLQPQPQKVPGALKQYLESDHFKQTPFEENTSILQMAFLFGRIAQLTPSLLHSYHEIFEQGNHQQRQFMIFVLQIGGDHSTRAFLEQRVDNPSYSEEKEWIQQALGNNIPLGLSRLQKEIQNGDDLDLQWGEFFITGNAAPVEKIIGVLGREDILRKKIEAFLRSTKQNEEVIRILEENFHLQTAGDALINPDDIDILIGMALMAGNVGEPFQELRKKVGDISDDDIFHAAVKSAAFWALSSNVMTHDRIIQIAHNALQQAQGAQKLALLNILSRASIQKEDFENAESYLETILAQDPQNMEALHSLFSVYLENKSFPKARDLVQNMLTYASEEAAAMRNELKLSVLETLSVPFDAKAIDGSQLINAFQKQESAVKGYTSRIKLFTHHTGTGVFSKNIEWRFSHVKPDRYDVEQYAENAADKWRSIGDEHYMFFGFWVQAPAGDDIGRRHETNAGLDIQKYYELAMRFSPAGAKEFTVESDVIGWLQFKDVENWQLIPGQKNKYDVELMMTSSGFLKKAVVSWDTMEGKYPLHHEYIQVFDYPEGIEITPPETVLNTNLLDQA